MSYVSIENTSASVLNELKGARVVFNILNGKVLSETFSSYTPTESDLVLQQWTQASSRLSILEQRYAKLTGNISFENSNNSSISSTPRSVCTPILRSISNNSINTPSIPQLPLLNTNLFGSTSSSSPTAINLSPTPQANIENDTKYEQS
jgi:hypothetical protein